VRREFQLRLQLKDPYRLLLLLVVEIVYDLEDHIDPLCSSVDFPEALYVNYVRWPVQKCSLMKEVEPRDSLFFAIWTSLKDPLQISLVLVWHLSWVLAPAVAYQDLCHQSLHDMLKV
jgi:hypothetical protein